MGGRRKGCARISAYRNVDERIERPQRGDFPRAAPVDVSETGRRPLVAPESAQDLQGSSAWPRNPRGNSLFHQLELARLPRLVEPRLSRAIEPKQHVPSFARHCLNPGRLMALRRGRAEPNIDRGVWIDHDAFRSAAGARKLRRKPTIGPRPMTFITRVECSRPY